VHAASPSGGVVTVSVGVASLMARADQAPLVLVEAADAALYDAKRSGRGRFAVAREAGA
jgi:PleD family two-component response regulator